MRLRVKKVCGSPGREISLQSPKSGFRRGKGIAKTESGASWSKDLCSEFPRRDCRGKEKPQRADSKHAPKTDGKRLVERDMAGLSEKRNGEGSKKSLLKKKRGRVDI